MRKSYLTIHNRKRFNGFLIVISFMMLNVAFVQAQDTDGDGISDAIECAAVSGQSWTESNGMNIYTVGGLTDGTGNVASGWTGIVGASTDITDWIGGDPYIGVDYTVSVSEAADPGYVGGSSIVDARQSSSGGTGFFMRPSNSAVPKVFTITITFTAPVYSAGFDLIALFDYFGGYDSGMVINVDGVPIWQKPLGPGVGSLTTGNLNITDGAGNPQGTMNFGLNTENFIGVVSPTTFSTITIDYTLNGPIANSNPEILSFDNLRFSTALACADADGDSIPNLLDLDSDNDGIPDANEGVGNLDGDAFPNYLDLDSDGDGISDIIEAGGVDADGDGHVDYPTAGDPSTLNDLNSNGLDDSIEATPLPLPDNDFIDGLSNYLDIDSDFDGIVDNIESQSTAGYIAPSGSDTDNDGLDDSYDSDDETVIGIGGGTALASIIPVNTDGVDNPDYTDTDSDNDGEFDIVEGWDFDNDGTPETTFGGLDADTDGLYTNYDSDDSTFDPTNGGQLPTSFPDTDNDLNFGGDVDFRDNFLNPDFDLDGIPDVGDLDDDNDGILDIDESSGNEPDGDADGDGLPNWQDVVLDPGVGDGSTTDYTDADNNGIPDVYDSDGDGLANHLEYDSDGDGINDIVEGGNGALDTDNDGVIDPALFIDVAPIDGLHDGVLLNLDTDGDTIINALDLDSDNDGILDSEETIIDTDGDLVPNYLDLDVDNDGILDLVEAGYGALDTDADGRTNGAVGINGVDDSIETAPDSGVLTNPTQNSDTDIVPDYRDIDSDADGIPDNIEAQTTAGYSPPNGAYDANGIDTGYSPSGIATPFPNTDVAAVGGDLIPDYLDTDSDADGLPDVLEGWDFNDDFIAETVPSTADADGDGLVDEFDVDDANLDATNGVGAIIDNTDFPDVDNTGGDLDWREELDSDGDGLVDTLDPDDNNDGILDVDEGITDPLADIDGDGWPAFLDDNDNDDTIGDTNGVEAAFDKDSDGIPNHLDFDDDNDGIPDSVETVGVDTDGDGIPNFLDLDSDNDGITDATEAGGLDADGDGELDGFVDADLDGLNDLVDDIDSGAGVTEVTGGIALPITNSDLAFTGDALPNYIDLDSDADGISDIVEAGGIDADGDGHVDYPTAGDPTSMTDADADGLTDDFVVDTDNDTIADQGIDPTNGGIMIPLPNTDGDTVADYIDIDSDADGIVDNIEAQVSTLVSGYRAPSGNDSDVDGIDDNYDIDFIGNIVPVDTDIDGTPDYLDTNSDDDIHDDVLEGWDANNNDIIDGAELSPNGGDADNDGLDNGFDADSGNLDPTNGGQNASNFPDLDTPGGEPDWREALDIDWDNDGIDDPTDLDDDNDGIPDTDEGGDVLDTDGDGVPNRYDLDSDNDGIYDLVESGQLNNTTVVDVGNDGILDGAPTIGAIPGDFGFNGLLNLIETSPDSGILANATADSSTDTDGTPLPNGIPDSLELNSDTDGCPDVTEAGFTDSDGSGRLGSDTGLLVDVNGLVTTGVGSEGYTTPSDLDNTSDPGNNDPGYDFQEFGENIDIDITTPEDETVILTFDANFDLTLNNGVNPTYVWYESTDLGVSFNPLSDGGIYTGATTATLTINANSLALDENLYYVEASAPGYACDGTVTSRIAELNVLTDFDGDGIADIDDLDDDNDGIPDSDEGTGDLDGDLSPNHQDWDADGDGVFDMHEAGYALNGGTIADDDNNGMLDGLPAAFGTNGLLDALEIGGVDGAGINYTIQNTDGDSASDFLDIDDDGDSVYTIFENADPDGNMDPSDAIDTDTNTIPNYLDADDDGDNVNTIFEVNNNDGDGNPGTNAFIDTDSDNTLDYLDIDDDGDTVNTIYEVDNTSGDGNPNTDPVNTDGTDMLDYLDIDDDNDSVLSIYEVDNSDGDNNPNTNPFDTDNDLIWNHQDADDDGDEVNTIFENPVAAGDNGNPVNAQNTDNDADADYLDEDDDGDTVWTIFEGPNPDGDNNPNTNGTLDTNFDGEFDYLDIDDDGDGVNTEFEGPDADGDGNPSTGATQDTDTDDIFDYLDIDDDNDGIMTITEGDNNDDSDAFPNYLDQDSDGDGLPDNVEGQSTENYVAPSNSDDDNDGLDDAYDDDTVTNDNSNYLSENGIQANDQNNDSEGEPDYLDLDSDNDFVLDFVEGHDFDADGNPDIPATNQDSDGDGLDDAYDSTNGFDVPNGIYVTDSPETELPNRDQSLFDELSATIGVGANSFVTPDAEVDFRDDDDDGDGILTNEPGEDGEDTDSDGDPRNDNCNGPPDNNSPNYLDPVPCNFIPSGFSPNDDNLNDEFIINGLERFRNFTMEVYDRWGNVVYEYNNNGKTEPDWWNGFSTGSRTLKKGEKVPAGTYYYVIEYNEAGRKPIAGWVYVNY